MHKVLITEKRDTHPLDQGHVATRSIDHEQVKDHEPRGTPQRNKDYMRSIRPTCEASDPWKRTGTDFAQVMSPKISIAMKKQESSTGHAPAEESGTKCTRNDSRKEKPETF